MSSSEPDPGANVFPGERASPALRRADDLGLDESTDPADRGLVEVDALLRQAGYCGQFRAEDGRSIRCLSCRGSFPAHDVHADRVHRLEGASDPADLTLVIPLTCPICEARGTLISPYGPEAPPEEAEVLLAMQRHPAEGDRR